MGEGDIVTADRELTEGDIFSWRYTEPAEAGIRKVRHDPYHCKSRVAIFRNGRLQDTYWSGLSNDGVLDTDRVVLTFLGNPSAMQKINEWERVFYRYEDLVDMRHSNSTGAPVYVKLGAKRDAAAMREYFLYKGQRFNSDIETAQRKIVECRNAVAAIDRGEIDGHFPTWDDRK